jgi:hypothetical protein
LDHSFAGSGGGRRACRAPRRCRGIAGEVQQKLVQGGAPTHPMNLQPDRKDLQPDQPGLQPDSQPGLQPDLQPDTKVWDPWGLWGVWEHSAGLCPRVVQSVRPKTGGKREVCVVVQNIPSVPSLIGYLGTFLANNCGAIQDTDNCGAILDNAYISGCSGTSRFEL